MMIDNAHNILLVEDNADDEGLALRALRCCEQPLLVRVARDGELALHLLGLDGAPGCQSHKIPDLVICDFKMPKLSAPDVLRRVRANPKLSGVPIIVFSSSDEAADIQSCLELGADDYASKPIDFALYGECIRNIVRRWLPVRGTRIAAA